MKFVIIVEVFRGVAQVVERYFREVEAASSSLVTPIEKNLIITVMVVIRFFGAIYALKTASSRSNIFKNALNSIGYINHFRN